MTLITKNLARYPADANGLSKVNIAEIAKLEDSANRRDLRKRTLSSRTNSTS